VVSCTGKTFKRTSAKMILHYRVRLEENEYPY